MSQSKTYQATSSNPQRVAFIQACWHKDIVDQALVGFAEAMEKAGFPQTNLDLFEVPGVFEIPLQAKKLAQTGAYDVIVAAGFVVDGGIYRHDFVSAAVIDGLMRVQLDTETPILSVVLTPQQFHEHAEHQNFFRNHFVIKGREAAATCLDRLGALRGESVAKAA